MKITITIEPTDEEIESPGLPEVSLLWDTLTENPNSRIQDELKRTIADAIRHFMRQQGLEGKFRVMRFGVELGPTFQGLDNLVKSGPVDVHSITPLGNDLVTVRFNYED